MEENKTTNNKLSYEQLEQIALQLQQRVIQVETRLEAINLATIKLDYLFKVLDKHTIFPTEAINNSITEIIKLLEIGDSKKIETKDSESMENN